LKFFSIFFSKKGEKKWLNLNIQTLCLLH